MGEIQNMDLCIQRDADYITSWTSTPWRTRHGDSSTCQWTVSTTDAPATGAADRDPFWDHQRAQFDLMLDRAEDFEEQAGNIRPGSRNRA